MIKIAVFAACRPMIYVPFRQFASLRFRDLLVRSVNTDPGALVPAIRAMVLAMDDDLPLMGATTLVEAFSSSMARERFVALLVASFGTIALLLAAIGTYGVLVREGMGLVMVGFLLGGLGLLAVAPLLRPLLFGIRADDGLTLAVVSAVLLGSGLLACLSPAHRAARVDPVITLRHE